MNAKNILKETDKVVSGIAWATGILAYFINNESMFELALLKTCIFSAGVHFYIKFTMQEK